MSKLKTMKMEHMRLLEVAEAYKKYVADISDLGLIIKSKMNEQTSITSRSQILIGSPKKTLKFDVVFGPQVEQDIFEDTVPFATLLQHKLTGG
ncbi:unnamed protein product [Trifolium pratense]|uniref:Uncharacterized protein n=1 Tax=Trifolium pratense TaxID=57577 RepID=A0ACB0J186_TRIPR|nr:unnamed protein product [Trifolium pratense]